MRKSRHAQRQKAAVSRTDSASRRSIAELLQHEPRPLIDPRAGTVVIFSPKSACTNVAIWFLHHLGHLQAARDYYAAPHRYRHQVYYESKLYRSCQRMDLSKFKVIRVVRDPYDRVASMFRHTLRTKSLMHNPLVRVRQLFGIQPRLSFADFLNRLDRMDLHNCDPHFQVQRHPIEDHLSVNYLINVSRENLFERLAQIEDDLGLPRSNLANSNWVKQRSERHHRASAVEGDIYQRPFTPTEARNGPWPDYATFLAPKARERIARLYAVDIQHYSQPQGFDPVSDRFAS
jgi:hypothetical protein